MPRKKGNCLIGEPKNYKGIIILKVLNLESCRLLGSPSSFIYHYSSIQRRFIVRFLTRKNQVYCLIELNHFLIPGKILDRAYLFTPRNCLNLFFSRDKGKQAPIQFFGTIPFWFPIKWRVHHCSW